jgi:hypothetical protein
MKNALDISPGRSEKRVLQFLIGDRAGRSPLAKGPPLH